MDEDRKINLKPLLIIVIVIAICSVIFNIILLSVIKEKSQPYFSDGPINENGKDTLRIYNYDGDGKGGSAFYTILNDGVMSIEESPKWRTLRPNIPGHCAFAVEDYFAVETVGIRIYDIVVDENLYIICDKRDADKFFCADLDAFKCGVMTVQSDSGDIVLSEQTADMIRSEIDSLYGTDKWAGYYFDVSDCRKLICKYTTDSYEKLCEFYVSDDRMYYCDIYAGQENWYEFVPDELCSIDEINELLDSKD